MASLRALAVFCALVGASPIPAQCGHSVSWASSLAGVAQTPSWSSPYAVVDVAVEWDPDQTGPATPVLVLGGTFEFAGPIAAKNIVAVDLATGASLPFGVGLPEPVRSLAVLANGDLVAGGWPMQGVRRWAGTSWLALGTNLLGAADSLLARANGDLLAGSYDAGWRVMRWDGQLWQPMGAAFVHPVAALAEQPNGEVLAGSAGQVYSWNGTAWINTGTVGTGGIEALHVLANGDVVAAAWNGLARWNGAAWTNYPLPYTGIYSVASLPNGDVVVAGGDFAGIGSGCSRWDGTAWSSIGEVPAYMPGQANPLRCLRALSNGELLVGGGFISAGDAGARCAAIWNGTAWRSVWRGTDTHVRSFVRERSGLVIAGGDFLQIGGVPANHIASWDGAGWSAMGTGTDGRVTHTLVRHDGSIVIAGEFHRAGGIDARGLARWNGAAWTPMAGLKVDGWVSCLAQTSTGDLWVSAPGLRVGTSATSGLARWNGTTWSLLPCPTAQAKCLLPLPTGEVIGGFTAPWPGGENLWRWNGSAWSFEANAPPIDMVALVHAPGGAVIALGGPFTAGASPVRIWNGTVWSPLGTGLTGILVGGQWLPNGELLVVGNAQVGGIAGTFARWNGSVWSIRGPTVMSTWGVDSYLVTPPGDIWLGGRFLQLGGSTAAYLASLAADCPATAVIHGSPCAGIHGPIEFAAESLPWLGSSFTASACAIPADNVVIAATGWSPQSVPLATALPQALPGCQLLVDPQFLDLFVPSGGTVLTALPIPNALPLVGQSLYQQLVPIELAVGGAIVQATSSNALRFTIGAL